MFSAEKIFTVNDNLNRRNERYIAKTKAEVKGTFRTKHTAEIVVFSIVVSDGKTIPIKFYNADEKSMLIHDTRL